MPAKPNSPRRAVLIFWLPVSLLIGWQVLASTRILDPLFFPPPSSLVSAALRLLESGELTGHIRITLVRLSAGFVIGSIAGLAAGVLMGGIPGVRTSLEPLISALNSTPKISLLPMLMLLLGVDETPRIVLIAATCFVMLSMHGLDAVRDINPAYVELAENYGAGPMMVLRKVYLPAVLPQVFTGLRVSLGRALTITVALELISCPDGLGSMIWMAWQTFSTEKLYVGVISAAILGGFFHHSLLHLERRLIPWKR